MPVRRALHRGAAVRLGAGSAWVHTTAPDLERSEMRGGWLGVGDAGYSMEL